MTTNSTPLSDAFLTLTNTVRDWRQSGRVTTTAGLKSGLLDRTAGAFSERNLGFETFRDFVQAGAEAGHVELHQLETGHWIVLLPGESIDVVSTQSSAHADRQASSSPTSPTGSLRLRPEIWKSLVDWAPDHRRIWDKRHRRPIMFPVDQNGRPAWESDEGRFIDLPSADMETQIGWMREWINSLPDDNARVALLASIEEGSPRGRFRQELNRTNLNAAWRAELQRRVLLLASNWAEAQGVQAVDLMDHPRPPAQSLAPTSQSSSGPTSGAPASSRSSHAGQGELLQFREMLHSIIDSMTLAELASLPVRAEHLLRVRA